MIEQQPQFKFNKLKLAFGGTLAALGIAGLGAEIVETIEENGNRGIEDALVYTVIGAGGLKIVGSEFRKKNYYQLSQAIHEHNRIIEDLRNLNQNTRIIPENDKVLEGEFRVIDTTTPSESQPTSAE